MITRRGWWPALEPALLALTVVVCGGAPALANSHASAIACDHQCDTSSSHRWTSAVASEDPFDSDDDGDDGGDALPAAPIVLTSDNGHAGLLVETEFDVRLSLRSERLASRGPPDRGLPSWTADDSARHRQNSSDDDSVDDDDDDDDDDGLEKWTATAHPQDSFDAVRVEHSSPHFRHFDDTYAGDRNNADRASDGPARTPGVSQRSRQNSSDDNIDDDDDDDDDDDSSELGRSLPASNPEQTWILILSELDELFSFASDVQSLRAPPQ